MSKDLGLKKATSHHGEFIIEYFPNDCLAAGTVAVGKEWEPHILSFSKEHGFENAIDIGANFGYHTLFFSKIATGKVYAFEPQTQNYELLTNNIHHNKISNVVLYDKACSDKIEYVKMPLISTTNMINMGDFTPNVMVSSKHTIANAIPLDHLDLPKIDLIKIDVQGYEIKVLNGARSLISNYKPTLIIEFEQHQLIKTGSSVYELIQTIRGLGYFIFYLEYQYPSDHVCVHNDNLAAFNEKFKDSIFDHVDDNDINHNIHFGINKKIKIKTPDQK